MKIDLKSEQSRREIVNVRSLITNSTQLRAFDSFISKNTTFDFDNDEHIASLRSNKQDCHCTVSPTVPINL